MRNPTRNSFHNSEIYIQPAAPLTPQRLDIVDLLHSLRSQHERMLLLHANAVLDADAHAAEVGRVRIRVGNV